VTVRAQQPQVFDAVIVVDAVDVIEMEHETLATPIDDATRRAGVAPALGE